MTPIGFKLLLSGKTRDINNFITLPEHLRWNGTIIALRIPFVNETFRYIKYIEQNSYLCAMKATIDITMVLGHDLKSRSVVGDW